MMPRATRCRKKRCCRELGHGGRVFKPRAVPFDELEEIHLGLDEFEAFLGRVLQVPDGESPNAQSLRNTVTDEQALPLVQTLGFEDVRAFRKQFGIRRDEPITGLKLMTALRSLNLAQGRDEVFWMGLHEACQGYALLDEGQLARAGGGHAGQHQFRGGPEIRGVADRRGQAGVHEVEDGVSAGIAHGQDILVASGTREFGSHYFQAGQFEQVCDDPGGSGLASRHTRSYEQYGGDLKWNSFRLGHISAHGQLFFASVQMPLVFDLHHLG